MSNFRMFICQVHCVSILSDIFFKNNIDLIAFGTFVDLHKIKTNKTTRQKQVGAALTMKNHCCKLMYSPEIRSFAHIPQCPFDWGQYTGNDRGSYQLGRF